MKTADWSSLPKNIFLDVYEPAEDSFIMIDALETDLDFIKKIRPSICLEVGSGSGIISGTLATALGPISYLCTDINPVAVRATKILTQSNDVSVDVVQTDLVETFSSRLQNAVDVLIFNPPYVPSPSEEMNTDNLSLATCGGNRGREVMDRFFPCVPKLLSQKGVFYLTCISQNDIEDIRKHSSLSDLQMCVVLDRKCGMEHLFVLRFSFS